MTEPTEAEVRARHENHDGVCWSCWHRVVGPPTQATGVAYLDRHPTPCDTARVLALLDAERDSQAARDGRALAALREALYDQMWVLYPEGDGWLIEVNESWTVVGPTIEAAALAALAALPKEGRG